MRQVIGRMAVASAAALGLSVLVATAQAPSAAQSPSASTAATASAGGPEAACSDANLQKLVEGLPGARMKVQKIPDGTFSGATKFFAAKDKTPAFCQVSGSFVTNPDTGKTANFLATLPVNWNGKYLQLGCSGHCGQFYVSNPALPSITVTTQGYATEIVSKGYATFATDEGHVGLEGGKWAVKPTGEVDQDAITDFYYRADKVLADVGKDLTRAFYAQASGKSVTIEHSYFCGCSGGGRDAFVAAAYFPEKFDGIIAGSPYDIWGTTFTTAGSELAASRSVAARPSAAQYALMDGLVKAQCDKLDGVEDGIIQNPAACNFRPERDLPRCKPGEQGEQCFTQEQIETLSTIVSGVTDEHGHLVTPGYSVSEFNPVMISSRLADGTPSRTSYPGTPLWEAALKIFADKNDPKFSAASIFSFKTGGGGQVTDYHTVVSEAVVSRARIEGRMAEGEDPAQTADLIKQDRKFLIWHNFGDGNLSPYMSINYYKKAAKMYGGYDKLQKNVRLFMLPGTTHCSITSVGPNSFDVLTAMENWVEKGQVPDALLATVDDRQFSPGAPKAEALKFPSWTAKLCKFPEMARYSGKGDTKDAGNWTCPADDTRLLQVGESGRQAGVL